MQRMKKIREVSNMINKTPEEFEAEVIKERYSKYYKE